MRPPRPDIAAPPIPAGTRWIGEGPANFDHLLADRPALVHFLDFAQLNSVRAMPYVVEWRRRYADDGLAVHGIHSPRFPFTKDADRVAEALPGLGVDWAVALDPDLAIWRDYGCRGWPSFFLWGKGGVLRWYHLGEGEYAGTEEAIREALADAGAGGKGWPPLLEPLRPGDARDAKVIAPTPEVLPGGSLERPWRAGEGDPSISVEYGAGGAYAAVDGQGQIAVSLDGETHEPVEVSGPGLHELVSHEGSERHTLELTPSEEVMVYSLQFAAEVP